MMTKDWRIATRAEGELAFTRPEARTTAPRFAPRKPRAGGSNRASFLHFSGLLVLAGAATACIMHEPDPVLPSRAPVLLASERARAKAAEDALKADLATETKKLETCLTDALEIATARSNLEAELTSLDQSKVELTERLEGATARLRREAEARTALAATLAQRERDAALVAKWAGVGEALRGAASKIDSASPAARDPGATELAVELTLPEAFDAGKVAPSGGASAALGRVCAYLQASPGARLELRTFLPAPNTNAKPKQAAKLEAQALAQAMARAESAARVGRACGSGSAVSLSVAPAPSVLAGAERALGLRLIGPRIAIPSAQSAPTTDSSPAAP